MVRFRSAEVGSDIAPPATAAAPSIALSIDDGLPANQPPPPAPITD